MPAGARPFLLLPGSAAPDEAELQQNQRETLCYSQ
jgi:hypothetical protein